MTEADWKSVRSMIDYYVNSGNKTVSLYFSPDGGMSASISPWPDPNTGFFEDTYTIEITDEDVTTLEDGGVVTIRVDENNIIHIKKESNS